MNKRCAVFILTIILSVSTLSGCAGEPFGTSTETDGRNKITTDSATKNNQAEESCEENIMIDNNNNQYPSGQEPAQNSPVAADGTGKSNGSDLKSEAPSNDPSTAPVVIDPLPLLTASKPLSIKEYLNRFGAASLIGNPVTAAAKNIAVVSFNPVVFEPNRLQAGDRLALKLFDDAKLIINLGGVNYSSPTTTMYGSVFNHAGSSFTLSLTGNQVMLTIRLPEVNCIYLAQYNQQDNNHYLYKAALDQLEVLVDEPAPERLTTDEND